MLIFSVNSSGCFQGYARMVTPFGRQKGRWTGDAGILGPTFGIQWELLHDLPFATTAHLHNPLNEGLPVKVSRDGQEVPYDIGCALVGLMEKAALEAGTLRPQRRVAVDWETEVPEAVPAVAGAARSRSPERRKKSRRSRSRSRSRGWGHKQDWQDMTYEQYLSTLADTNASMEWWTNHLRSLGWDGRGGVAGMQAFWQQARPAPPPSQPPPPQYWGGGAPAPSRAGWPAEPQPGRASWHPGGRGGGSSAWGGPAAGRRGWR